MTTIYAPHTVSETRDAKHLAEVRAEMQRLGAPELRALWHEGYGVWLAIEGSHRLAIAHELGLTPVIVPVQWDTQIEHDFEDVPSPCAVQHLEDWLTDPRRIQHSAEYEFEGLSRGEAPTGYVAAE